MGARRLILVAIIGPAVILGALGLHVTVARGEQAMQSCSALAGFAQRVAEARDDGVPERIVRDVIVAKSGMPAKLRRALADSVATIYKLRTVPPEAVGALMFAACLKVQQ